MSAVRVLLLSLALSVFGFLCLVGTIEFDVRGTVCDPINFHNIYRTTPSNSSNHGHLLNPSATLVTLSGGGNVALKNTIQSKLLQTMVTSSNQ